MSLLNTKFQYEERPCRVAAFFPKKCSCGDCEKDDDYCDIVFTDNNEFKRHILFTNLVNPTDQRIIHDDVKGLPEAPEVQGKTTT